MNLPADVVVAWIPLGGAVLLNTRTFALYEAPEPEAETLRQLLTTGEHDNQDLIEQLCEDGWLQSSRSRW